MKRIAATLVMRREASAPGADQCVCAQLQVFKISPHYFFLIKSMPLLLANTVISYTVW